MPKALTAVAGAAGVRRTAGREDESVVAVAADDGAGAVDADCHLIGARVDGRIVLGAPA